MDDVENYQHFYDLLSGSIEKDSLILNMIIVIVVKINAANDDVYRSNTKVMRFTDPTQRNYHWHSYENKQNMTNTYLLCYSLSTLKLLPIFFYFKFKLVLMT